MARLASTFLTVALAALALAPASAVAQTDAAPIAVPAAGQLMTSAHALAIARWGMEPCGGQVTVTWAHMGAGINARSQWMSTDVHNPATYSSCAITYNLDVDWDWPKLCTVVEHELGHLAGHDHIDDPHNVMSPYYVYPAPECAGQRAVTPDPAPAAQRSTSPAASRKATVRKTKRKAVRRKTAKRKTVRHKATKRKTVKRKAATRRPAAKRP